MIDDLRVLALHGNQFQVVSGMMVIRIENRLPPSEITVCLSPYIENCSRSLKSFQCALYMLHEQQKNKRSYKGSAFPPPSPFRLLTYHSLHSVSLFLICSVIIVQESMSVSTVGI